MPPIPNSQEKIPTNTYSGLIAELELYGIDAGYTKGMYGPIFSDPYINVTYDIIIVDISVGNNSTITGTLIENGTKNSSYRI